MRKVRPGERRGDDDVELTTEELPGGITKVTLDGSLDITGAAAIDMRMNLVAGSSRKVMVDLEKVSFIGSMGLRTLILPARAVTGRGGKMLIFGPNPLVSDILRTSGLDTVVPIFHDYQAALDSLQ
jgi:anti-anti-sigma factor